MNIFFWSDTHFGHGNCIKWALRYPWIPQDYLDLINIKYKDVDPKEINAVPELREYRLSEQQIRQHDDEIIENYNAIVKPGDVVYHLGDFVFPIKVGDRHPFDYAKELFAKMNGEKHLIKGNHDRKWIRKIPFVTINDYKEIKVNNQRLVLCHYAFKVWNRGHYGSWNIYGHSHGTLPDDGGLQIDVGIDAIANRLGNQRESYGPMEFSEIAEFMKDRSYKGEDRHGE